MRAGLWSFRDTALRRSATTAKRFANARPNAEQEANIALLIDADNASPEHLDEVLLVLGELGTINIRRAYGNWAKASLKGWGGLTGQQSIVPVQQFDVVKGKSVTDMRMTIDAMDLLYRGHVDGFGIMSSDSDFLPLAQRIREEGLPVYGFGTAKTPMPFQQACTRFFDVGALALDDEEQLEQPATRQGPAAGRYRAAAGARLGLQGVQARRGRLYAAVRARASGPRRCRASPRATMASRRLSDLIKAVPEFRGEDRRRRTPSGQAPALKTLWSLCNTASGYSMSSRNLRAARRRFWRILTSSYIRRRDHAGQPQS